MSRDDRVQVQCDFGASPKCRQQWEVSRRAEDKNRHRNGGRLICLPCSRLIKYAGRSNPNCRYPSLRDDYFQNIDIEEKAYLLGWVASDGSIRADGSITLEIHRNDRHQLERLRDLLSKELPIYQKKNLVGLRFCSKQMAQDLCHWLRIIPGRKSSKVCLPDLAEATLAWAFIRGFFDGDGAIISAASSRPPCCSIVTGSAQMRQSIREFCGIPCSEYGDRLEWRGNNALDFLAHLYDDATIYLPRKRDRYLEWCTWVVGLTGRGNYGHNLHFRWVRVDARAVAPFKERASDSGYDLTLIEKVKDHGTVVLYTTGIRVQPEFGWYFDLVPRSSIIKSGYIVANSIGVIDRTYKGPIMVPLVKVDPAAPDLLLPSRIVQLVPRPIIHARWVEVDSLEETERGDGGFGSTGGS
jgi:deoxyuridine 5'-triphosphate nucleotidohydrolase